MSNVKPSNQQDKQTPKTFKILLDYGLSIGTFLLIGVFVYIYRRRNLDFSIIFDIRWDILKAFYITVRSSFIALVGSMILGLILYFFSISKVHYLKALTNVFTEIIYGTPLLVMIFMMGYVFRDAFTIAGFGFGTSMSFGIAGLTIYITPYMANIFRAAFSNIPDEQYMAMELFGFTTLQKYIYIIIPQVIRYLTAPLMNNFSLIIKGSALLHIVVNEEPEIFAILFSARNFTGRSIETFLVMWILYMMITIPLSQLTRVVERRWRI